MPDMMAIVSKSVFGKEAKGLGVGDTYRTSCYRSNSRGLDGLAEGGRLFLVTVRPGDVLWLVARLDSPKKTAKGWAATNETPIRDITALVGDLRFSTGKGVNAKPGKLGMSLQTPRVLSEGDVGLLGASTKATTKKSSPAHAPVKPAAKKPAPRPQPAAKKPAPKPKPAAAPKEDLDQIIAGRMESAIHGIRRVTGEADSSVIDTIVRWIDIDRWRANEAIEFWVHAFFLIMRFGEPRHLEALRNPPDLPVYSWMHKWVLRNRELAAKFIEYRSMDRKAKGLDKPTPRTKAKLMAHIASRLGDPDWKPTDELVALVVKPPFKPMGEEGLHIYAALLLHGEVEKLGPLQPLAGDDPIIAQILAAHGIEASRDEALGEELLASIYAHPDQIDTRAVYADWLMEQGDPRGDFIRAQLAGEKVALDDDDAQIWAGGLSEVIRWTGSYYYQEAMRKVRFARGFLSGCVVDSLDGSASTAPEWSTIEVLDVTGSVAKIDSYDLASLRVLGGLHSRDIPTLISSRVGPRLAGIGLRRVLKAHESQIWDQLEQLPGLRFVALGEYAFDASLGHHSLIKRVELLSIPPREKMTALRKRTTCVRGNSDGVWLPAYSELMQRLAKS